MNSKARTMTENYRLARAVGTPIISINCFDPAALMDIIGKNSNGSPIIQHDIVNGWRPRNEAGSKAIAKSGVDVDATINPAQMLEFCLKLPKDTIVFMQNAHHFIDKPDVSQAIWNLRDEFKFNGRTLILLSPGITLPVELQQDILILEEPLPTPEELREIITSIAESAEVKLNEESIEAGVDALRGLSAFPAEQTTAMSMRETGLDIDFLWDRKRQLINATPGLDVYEGDENFSDIGGCEQIKKFLKSVINGQDAPQVIVFIDEGEKMFSGGMSDYVGDGGVAKDTTATTLKYMEDNKCTGIVFSGVRGAAKSALAKAMGNEAGILTIALDLGGVKGGVVGESERLIRNAYKVINAVGARAYFVMTCNKMTALSPELLRRFTDGVVFFDVLDAASDYQDRTERDKVWPIHLKKYGIPARQVKDIDDTGWTGAEIHNVCRMAYRLKISLKEAAEYIIPVSVSGAADLEALRRQAHNAYLSANYPGKYVMPGHEETPNAVITGRSKRSMNLKGGN